MSVRPNFYNMIYQQVVKAYPQQSCEFHTAESKKCYDGVKNKGSKLEIAAAVEGEIKRLRELVTRRKTESMMYFIKVSEAKARVAARRQRELMVIIAAGIFYYVTKFLLY